MVVWCFVVPSGMFVLYRLIVYFSVKTAFLLIRILNFLKVLYSQPLLKDSL